MAHSPLRLRPARETDVPALVEIARRAWLSTFAQTAPFAILQAWVSLDREPAWYATHWPSMTVAEIRGRVAGLVQPQENEVNGLWIHPDAQGHGVGAQLLAEAERQIAAAGHDSVWLSCSTFNLRAQSFYARRGYHVTRRFVEPFAGVEEEVLIFQKALVGSVPA